MLRQRLRPTGAGQTVRVRVKGGYEPSVLHARAGERIRLVFTREETASCSEHVVFPAFGKSAMLPPFEDVTLELAPEHAGEYEFTCQLGMLRGRLVVEGDESERSESADSAPSEHAGGTRPREIGCGHRDAALLAFVAWLCSLPLLLLASVPFVGWRSGGVLGLIWLVIVAASYFAGWSRRLERRRVDGASLDRAGAPWPYPPPVSVIRRDAPRARGLDHRKRSPRGG